MARPNRRFKTLLAVSAIGASLAAVAFAGPKGPAIPTGPPWGIQFPGIAEVGVYSKDGTALATLCKGPSSPKVRAAPIKSLAFERVATGDRSIYKVVQAQSSKLKPMEVTVRFKPATTCTLQLKSANFSHYGIELGPNEKFAMERFTLVFSQATPLK